MPRRCDSCRRARAKCDMTKPSCSRCNARKLRCLYDDFAGYRFIDQTALAAQHVSRSRGLPIRASDATNMHELPAHEVPRSEYSGAHTDRQRSNGQDDRAMGYVPQTASSLSCDSDAVSPVESSALNLTILSQNKKDPFDAYHVGAISPIVDDAINYIYERLWPLSVLSPAPVGHSLCLAERRIQNPFWHHTTITQACAIWLNRHPEADDRSRKEIAALRIKHMAEGLKIMQEYANAPDASDSNEVLTYGTFRMAVQPSVRPITDSLDEAFPVSPMSTVQHLNIYGSLDITEGFTMTVIQRIRSNGGLTRSGNDDRMPTSRVFLFADIIVATRLDQPPLLDWPYPECEDRVFAWSADRYAADHEAITLVLRLGQGFRFLTQNLPNLGLLIDLMVEATALLDHHQRGSDDISFCPESWQLGRARNLAQFKLCELKRTHEFPELPLSAFTFRHDIQSIVIEICRLSLFIYSGFVLFPLPEATSVHGMYRSKLKLLLSNLNALYLGGGQVAWDLLTWAVTMGCLASKDSPNREKRWWHSQLRRSLSFHEVPSGDMEGVKAILSRLLWWDVALDPRLAVVLVEAGLANAADEEGIPRA